MATTRGQRKQTKTNPFLVLVLVLVAVLGTLGTLEATGHTELGLKRLWGGEVMANPNLTPVVLSSVGLQPGQRIAAPAIWNPVRQEFHYKLLDRAHVQKSNLIGEPSDVLGRVLARPKPANQAFIEADFLPKGSPEGLLGLVPEGMRSVTIDPSKVQGLGILGFKDRFDLIMTEAVDPGIGAAARQALDSRRHVSAADRMRLSAIRKGSRQELLARGAMVIRQAESRSTKKEIVLAIHSGDVEGTLAALAAGSDLYCVSGSGAQEDVPAQSEAKPEDPVEPYKWLFENSRDVEVYEGSDLRVKSVKKAEGQ